MYKRPTIGKLKDELGFVTADRDQLLKRCHSLAMQLAEARAACQRFVDKVDQGGARSLATYNEMKVILAKPAPDADVVAAGMALAEAVASPIKMSDFRSHTELIDKLGDEYLAAKAKVTR
jgi:hypothetical protein